MVICHPDLPPKTSQARESDMFWHRCIECGQHAGPQRAFLVDKLLFWTIGARGLAVPELELVDDCLPVPERSISHYSIPSILKFIQRTSHSAIARRFSVYRSPYHFLSTFYTSILLPTTMSTQTRSIDRKYAQYFWSLDKSDSGKLIYSSFLHIDPDNAKSDRTTRSIVESLPAWRDKYDSAMQEKVNRPYWLYGGERLAQAIDLVTETKFMTVDLPRQDVGHDLQEVLISDQHPILVSEVCDITYMSEEAIRSCERIMDTVKDSKRGIVLIGIGAKSDGSSRKIEVSTGYLVKSGGDLQDALSTNFYRQMVYEKVRSSLQARPGLSQLDKETSPSVMQLIDMAAPSTTLSRGDEAKFEAVRKLAMDSASEILEQNPKFEGCTFVSVEKECFTKFRVIVEHLYGKAYSGGPSGALESST